MDSEWYWDRQSFPTEAEAQAFEMGLMWGDEPDFVSDGIEPCTVRPGYFDVIFARTEMQEEADGNDIDREDEHYGT